MFTSGVLGVSWGVTWECGVMRRHIIKKKSVGAQNDIVNKLRLIEDVQLSGTISWPARKKKKKTKTRRKRSFKFEL
jgi:hypothetical protein